MSQPIISQWDLLNYLREAYENNIIKSSFSRAAWDTAVSKIVKPTPRLALGLCFCVGRNHIALLERKLKGGHKSIGVPAVTLHAQPPATTMAQRYQKLFDADVHDWERFGTLNGDIALMRAQHPIHEFHDTTGELTYGDVALVGGLKPEQHLGWLIAMGNNLAVKDVDINIPGLNIADLG